jgi:hypothetical protein
MGNPAAQHVVRLDYAASCQLPDASPTRSYNQDHSHPVLLPEGYRTHILVCWPGHPLPLSCCIVLHEPAPATNQAPASSRPHPAPAASQGHPCYEPAKDLVVPVFKPPNSFGRSAYAKALSAATHGQGDPQQQAALLAQERDVLCFFRGACIAAAARGLEAERGRPASWLACGEQAGC